MNDLNHQRSVLQARISEAKQALELAERELFKLDRPLEPAGNVILRWTKQFSRGGIAYHYAAVCVNGRVHTTAMKHRTWITWDALIEDIESDVADGFEVRLDINEFVSGDVIAVWRYSRGIWESDMIGTNLPGFEGPQPF